jgi:NAD(P)-dependent dehydrogenase (short-subunit alcohol dehydrogenase family)
LTCRYKALSNHQEYQTSDVRYTDSLPKQISVLSLYTTANWALPKLASLASSNSGSKPSLFVTSGGLYQNPFHPYFSLAASKAAQHNLTQSLAQVYAPQGVHVAAVVVNGFVGPESELFSPKKIAEVYWKLYEQGAEKGERSVWVSVQFTVVCELGIH